MNNGWMDGWIDRGIGRMNYRHEHHSHIHSETDLWEGKLGGNAEIAEGKYKGEAQKPTSMHLTQFKLSCQAAEVCLNCRK